MGKASLRFEELTSLLSEVEATIKSWKFTSHGTSAIDSSSFPDREETFLLTTKALHWCWSHNKQKQREAYPKMEVPPTTHQRVLEPVEERLFVEHEICSHSWDPTERRRPNFNRRGQDATFDVENWTDQRTVPRKSEVLWCAYTKWDDIKKTSSINYN